MTLERSNELLIDVETALLEAIMDAVTSNTFDKTAKLILAYKEFITTKNMRNASGYTLTTPPQYPQFTYAGANIPNTTGTLTVSGNNIPAGYSMGYHVVSENHSDLADYISTTTEINLNE